MEKIIMCLIFIGCCSVSRGQTLSTQKELKESFDVLIKHFQDDKKMHLEQFRKNGVAVNAADFEIKLPVLWQSNLETDKDKMIKVVISDDPIMMKTKETILENPFGNGFPVSYSVIYQDRLVSLFDSGQFVCHSIPAMQRDLSFEKKINTKKIDYHWVIGDKLVGISQEQYYYLDSNDTWINYKENIPLKNQPKLFEDESYISFCDCEGEFGGTVYFYNKATRKITYTESTCANTVYKKEGKYYILSDLLHMFGSTKLKIVPNPDQLTMIDIETIRSHFHGLKAIGYSDKSYASWNIFSFIEIVFYSTFDYEGRTVYLTYLPVQERTVLAEVENKTIKVISPLLNSDLFMHYPITTSYSNAILVNGAYFKIGLEREVSCIIIKDNEFIKVHWNNKYR